MYTTTSLSLQDFEVWNELTKTLTLQKGILVKFAPTHPDRMIFDNELAKFAYECWYKNDQRERK